MKYHLHINYFSEKLIIFVPAKVVFFVFMKQNSKLFGKKVSLQVYKNKKLAPATLLLEI